MKMNSILGTFGLFALLTSAASASLAADVGRLFFTPAERLAFERARQAAEAGSESEITDPDPVIAVPVIETLPQTMKPMITVDGYVRRSRGTTTLWVNGENSYDGDLYSSQVDPNSTHISGGIVRLAPMDGDYSIGLKPGQTYDPNSIVTIDAYEMPVMGDDLGRR